MALIKCSECGKEISDRAGVCPGCGAPVGGGAATPRSSEAVTRSVRVERAGFKWEAIGVVLILVAIVSSIAGAVNFAGVLGFIGFIVYMVGRFIN